MTETPKFWGGWRDGEVVPDDLRGGGVYGRMGSKDGLYVWQDGRGYVWEATNAEGQVDLLAAALMRGFAKPK